MRKRPLMQIACVFLIGLTCQRFSAYGLAVVVGLMILRECRIGRKTKEVMKYAGRSVLLLSAFFIGVFHMQGELNYRQAYMSKIEDGSRITVWGECIKTETTEYGYRGILSDCYIGIEEGIVPCNDIMVYTSEDHLKIGQIHKMEGKVKLFSTARNEGNFDARVYYQSMKIDFALEEEEYWLLEENRSSLKRQLVSLKEKISTVYKSNMEEEAAGFYQVMVLGDKLDLDQALKDLFLIGGISHILAISGLHVSILGRGMYRLLRRGSVGFFLSGLLSGGILVFYCRMVGSSTSTVRAVGMMLLLFLAQWIGRSYDMLNALGAMVLLLLWENPFLIENSGFWFSVTALLGVGFVGNALVRRMSSQKEEKTKEKKVWFQRVDFSGIWVSLGITLTTLPVTALSYYEVPLYAPLVNYIVLPLLTPVFGLAVAGGLLGVLFPNGGLTAVILLPCQWLLDFYEWICTAVSQLPGAVLISGKPEWCQVTFYYMLLIGGICFMQQRKENKATIHFLEKGIGMFPQSILLLGIIVVCCSLCIFFPKARKFEITFLDVGQGDGIYISGGDGSNYFIDGGSSDVNGVGEYRILPFLKARGVHSIDYWLVSHCDMDHMAGLLEIMENGYKIEHIVLHELCSSEERKETIIKLAEEKGIKVIVMGDGDRICSTQIEMQNLTFSNWKDSAPSRDENENSLVLQLEWKSEKNEDSFKALFAGDISAEVEKSLCEAGILEDIDLLKANHHGSNYSNSTLFLETLRPEYIVVSCSENNRYGHPGVQAVERMENCGAEIFYTMNSGQIMIKTVQSDDFVEVNRFR